MCPSFCCMANKFEAQSEGYQNICSKKYHYPWTLGHQDWIWKTKYHDHHYQQDTIHFCFLHFFWGYWYSRQIKTVPKSHVLVWHWCFGTIIIGISNIPSNLCITYNWRSCSWQVLENSIHMSTSKTHLPETWTRATCDVVSTVQFDNLDYSGVLIHRDDNFHWQTKSSYIPVKHPFYLTILNPDTPKGDG